MVSERPVSLRTRGRVGKSRHAGSQLTIIKSGVPLLIEEVELEGSHLVSGKVDVGRPPVCFVPQRGRPVAPLVRRISFPVDSHAEGNLAGGRNGWVRSCDLDLKVEVWIDKCKVAEAKRFEPRP